MSVGQQEVHPTAIVSTSARLGDNVRVDVQAAAGNRFVGDVALLINLQP